MQLAWALVILMELVIAAESIECEFDMSLEAANRCDVEFIYPD